MRTSPPFCVSAISSGKCAAASSIETVCTAAPCQPPRGSANTCRGGRRLVPHAALRVTLDPRTRRRIGRLSYSPISLFPANPSPTTPMNTRSSTSLVSSLSASLSLLCFATCALAQQMPQDNWRYDGLQFADPTNNVPPPHRQRQRRNLSGEVNGGAATKVIQFTEGGVFVRRFATAFTSILGIGRRPAS